MKWRTITRPNGDADHRERVYGWDSVLPYLAIIAAIVAAWVSMNREVSALAAGQEDFRNEFNARVLEAADSHRAFVSRLEFNASEAAIRELLIPRIDPLQKQLDDFIQRSDANQRHALGILERLPGAKETRQ